MSYIHFQYAKEIERILKMSAGLTRRALYEAITISDKNEQRFGEVLAELCQGKEPPVTMVKPPGAFTIYYHNGSAPRLANAKTWVPKRTTSAPQQELPKLPPTDTSKWRSRQPVRICKCGAKMPYSGRGRPPVTCLACRQKEVRAIVEMADKLKPGRAKEFCKTCGVEIIHGGWGPHYTECRRCRKRAAKTQSRCPMCGHILNKPMAQEPT